mgnify:CR=1 FL=1
MIQVEESKDRKPCIGLCYALKLLKEAEEDENRKPKVEYLLLSLCLTFFAHLSVCVQVDYKDTSQVHTPSSSWNMPGKLTLAAASMTYFVCPQFCL